MDAEHVATLFKRKSITAAQRDALLRLVEAGVVDPCTSGCTPALAKLWYANLPACRQRGGAIADVRDLILRKGASHYAIASCLGSAFATCMPLNDYLKEWLTVSHDPILLEAVAWRWLDAAGALHDNYGDDPETVGTLVSPGALTLAQAEQNPGSLVHLLALFRRRMKLTTVHPCALVDTLALARNWWSKDSPVRADTIVGVHIEDALMDHEWVYPPGIVEGMEAHEVEAAVSRMIERNELVSVGHGISTQGIVATSRAVKRAIAAYEARDAPEPFLAPGDEDAHAGSLTDEQRALFCRIVHGKRLTLCCSPAGTGKTHTAAMCASVVENVLCLAPTWKAISVLRGKLDATFMTVQSFMLQLVPPNADLVIVDETSMLTMHQTRRILEAYVDKENTRLLFMGDDVQLPCIGRGFPIRDLVTAMHTMRLTRCMRTNGKLLIAIAQSVREGTNPPTLTDDDDVTITWAYTNICEVMKKDVDANVVPPWSSDYVQLISPQNKHVDALNGMVQTVKGTKTDDGILFGKCYVNDAVRFIENTESYKNGDEGILVSVEKVNGKRKKGNYGKKENYKGVVTLKNGTHVTVCEGHVVPAYATTVHKVQGSEYPSVTLALFPGTHPNLKTREMLYTSVTRAKEHLRIIGDLSSFFNATPLERRTVFAFV